MSAPQFSIPDAIGKIDVDDYQRGWSDCKDGVPHEDKSESYSRGYRARYEHEQALTHRSMQHGS